MDYRFVEDIYCCGDDHSYFVHAETIAQDFDFDYSNQLENVEGKVYINNNKIVPLGFVGTGILSAPFMFIGIVIDRLLLNFQIFSSQIMSYKILLYSFSPIFYLIASFSLFSKILYKLNIEKKEPYVLLVIFGSGIHYYAFERYSMTHVYEFFTTTLIMYLLVLFHSSKSAEKKYVAFLLPIAYLISFLVRYVNYFVFLIPFWIHKFVLQHKSEDRLIKNKYFLISSALSVLSFSAISFRMYGKVSFRPLLAYDKETFPLISNYISYSSEGNNFIINNISNLIKIFTTQEFGIILFIPIVAVSIIYLVSDVLKNKQIDLFRNIIILLSIFMPIGLVLIWQTVASGFGMRYIYSIIPISLIVYFRLHTKSKKFSNSYLILFSIFSLFSVLFFETSALSSLSDLDQMNSFGKVTRWAQPYYFSGVIKSFFSFDSYQIIFATSLFGSLVMKTFINTMGIENFLNFLSTFGLDVTNYDVLRIFNNIESVDTHKILFAFLVSIICTYWIYSILTKRSLSYKIYKI